MAKKFKDESRQSFAWPTSNLMIDRDDDGGDWWALAQTPWGLVAISSYTHHPTNSAPIRFYHFRCCMNGRLHMWRSTIPQSKRGALIFARRMTKWLKENKNARPR